MQVARDSLFRRKWSTSIAKHGYTMMPNVLLDEAHNLGLSSSELVVLLVLEKYRWVSDQEVYPSYETIALQAGLSGKTVSRIVEKLVKNDLLKISSRSGNSHLYDISPLITLLDDIAKSRPRRGHYGMPNLRQNVGGSTDTVSSNKYSKNSEEDVQPTSREDRSRGLFKQNGSREPP